MAAPWSFVMSETYQVTEHHTQTRRIRLCRRRSRRAFRGRPARRARPHRAARADARRRSSSRHDYPEPVARLLAEACVLTVLLGTSLKFEGKFILQTRTDGPVDMLVADFSTPAALRAYARFDADAAGRSAMAAGKTAPEQLLGSGVLALTIDQGAHTQRYQGIVQLDGETLEDVARVYFRQSEQIPTDVRLSVAKLLMPGGRRRHASSGGPAASWRSSCRQAPERLRLPDLPGGDGDPRRATQ